MRCLLTCCSVIGLAVLLSPVRSMAAGRAPAGAHHGGQAMRPSGGGMGASGASGGLTAGTLTMSSQSFTTPGGTNGSVFINANGYAVTAGSTYKGQPTGTTSTGPGLFIFGSGQTSSGLTGAELIYGTNLSGSQMGSNQTGSQSNRMGAQSGSGNNGLTMGTIGAANFQQYGAGSNGSSGTQANNSVTAGTEGSAYANRAAFSSSPALNAGSGASLANTQTGLQPNYAGQGGQNGPSVTNPATNVGSGAVTANTQTGLQPNLPGQGGEQGGRATPQSNAGSPNNGSGQYSNGGNIAGASPTTTTGYPLNNNGGYGTGASGGSGGSGYGTSGNGDYGTNGDTSGTDTSGGYDMSGP